jgi:hypothetical protein
LKDKDNSESQEKGENVREHDISNEETGDDKDAGDDKESSDKFELPIDIPFP